MADDPVVFLEAALGRAEELARASNTYRLIAVPGPQTAIAWIVDEALCLLKAGVPTAEHIVEHSPAAVLRRVKADRAILAEHGPAANRWTPRTVCANCGMSQELGVFGVPYPCRTVRLLAEAWGWEETT